MEMARRSEEEKGGVRLPIGFRFLPTDEQLLIHYLKRKLLSLPLPATVIPEFEAFRFNPWDLPGDMKEKRYFFTKRTRNLTNKCSSSSFSTDCGYWKSTGKDKQIIGAGSNYVIGVKKSFVFYQGRKLKTQWVMKELSLAGYVNTPLSTQRLMMQVGDWGVCRLYQRERRVRVQHTTAANSNKSLNFKNELGLSSSSSSGITHISSADADADLDQEASSQC